MNWKFLVFSLVLLAIILPETDAWWSRRRRRRRPKPQPPPGPSQHCRNQFTRYSVITGNNIHELARQWAPAVKLAKGEPWKPSSIDFFLKNMKLVGGPSHASQLTPENLPGCNSNCYLTTKGNLNCASCTNLPFLHGEPPAKAPVYTTIEKTGNVVEIIYRFFFPYNRGKRVCVGLYGNNMCPCFKTPWGCACPRVNCIGKYSTFGHHVADWEHIKIRFENNHLHSMYLSIHDSSVTNKYGGTFRWNSNTGKFQKGNRDVKMESCTHGIIYAAEGSHGIWPNPGNHVYKNLKNGEKLTDKCSHGQAWNTWNDLRITDKKPRGQYRGKFQFLNFQGRWGNRERKCGLAKKLFNVCILENGPNLSV